MAHLYLNQADNQETMSNKPKTSTYSLKDERFHTHVSTQAPTRKSAHETLPASSRL